MPLGGVHKLRLQDLAFFDHLPPSVYIFYGLKVYKKLVFLTTYPPPLVNVVCEQPLMKEEVLTFDRSLDQFLGFFVYDLLLHAKFCEHNF